MKTRSLYKKIVLSLLAKMKQGKLHLVLPGEEFYFGKEKETTAELIVKDEAFFKKVVLYGDVGFGEAYMEGIWETPNLTDVVAWFIKNIKDMPGMSGAAKAFNPINLLKFTNRIEHVFKPNSQKGSSSNISRHYDLNNDFFKLFLDPSMTYSSAFFANKNQTLKEAQANKYDSLCQMMKISDKDHVLEIGCGWGGFAVFAAQKYKCRITGITISKEQFKYATERVHKAGLENQIEILLKDYRELEGHFDKVVSIEMIEAVGHRYFKSYFGKINQVLSEKGVLGLQAIIIPDNRYKEYRKSVDWIQKHIFPGGLLPSIGKINETINLTGDLNLFNLKDMGLSYAQTLHSWFVNFQNNLEKVKHLGFDESFVRKWQYYLCSCEAAFAERNISVVQMVYSRPNNPYLQ